MDNREHLDERLAYTYLLLEEIYDIPRIYEIVCAEFEKDTKDNHTNFYLFYKGKDDETCIKYFCFSISQEWQVDVAKKLCVTLDLSFTSKIKENK